MASMIEKTMAKTWDEDMEDLEECISEACLTYEGMGQLLAEMMNEYILDTM